MQYRRLGRSGMQVSAFAYGMGKSRARSAIGVDFPLERVGGSGVDVMPFAEYHIDYVTAAADPAYDRFRAPRCRGSSPTAGSGADPCSDNKDQQWVTMGVRTAPTAKLAGTAAPCR